MPSACSTNASCSSHHLSLHSHSHTHHKQSQTLSTWVRDSERMWGWLLHTSNYHEGIVVLKAWVVYLMVPIFKEGSRGIARKEDNYRLHYDTGGVKQSPFFLGWYSIVKQRESPGCFCWFKDREKLTQGQRLNMKHCIFWFCRTCGKAGKCVKSRKLESSQMSSQSAE